MKMFSILSLVYLILLGSLNLFCKLSKFLRKFCLCFTFTLQVNGFPTLLLYHNGQRIAEYEGDRSLDDMVSFITLRIPHDEL